ncbi:MAG: amino acid ABC transporter permease, partial [Dermatophilaceae bacterium]
SYKSNPVPALIVIAIIFIVINYALTTVASYVEKQLRSRGQSTMGPGAVATIEPGVGEMG